MKLNISHKTQYSFETPVSYALYQIRLTPKERPGQTVLNWNIEVLGGQKELEFDDHHNNRVILVSLEPECPTLEIVSAGVVDTNDTSGVLGKHGGFVPLWHFIQQTELTCPGTKVRALTKSAGTSAESDLDKLHTLSAKILSNIKYETNTSTVSTTAEEALTNGKGVCQDHTHVFLSASRLLGYPSRYVSGYLMLNESIDQDASHAWAEVHVEGLGWVGFDISNGISPDERYVPVATGLDYTEATPISGLRYGAGSESMIVSLQVQQ